MTIKKAVVDPKVDCLYKALLHANVASKAQLIAALRSNPVFLSLEITSWLRHSESPIQLCFH